MVTILIVGIVGTIIGFGFGHTLRIAIVGGILGIIGGYATAVVIGPIFFQHAVFENGTLTIPTLLGRNGAARFANKVSAGERTCYYFNVEAGNPGLYSWSVNQWKVCEDDYTRVKVIEENANVGRVDWSRYAGCEFDDPWSGFFAIPLCAHRSPDLYRLYVPKGGMGIAETPTD